MAKSKSPQDPDLLKAALIGFTKQRDELDKHIEDLRLRLGTPKVAKAAKPTTHRISAEGRARIAAAQRKRWAAQKRTVAAHG